MGDAKNGYGIPAGVLDAMMRQEERLAWDLARPFTLEEAWAFLLVLERHYKDAMFSIQAFQEIHGARPMLCVQLGQIVPRKRFFADNESELRQWLDAHAQEYRRGV